MKQVAQRGRDGAISVVDAPPPALGPGGFCLSSIDSASLFSWAGMIVLRVLVAARRISAHFSLEALIWGRVVAEVEAKAVLGGSAIALVKRALWPHRRARLRTLMSRRREITGFSCI
jgi:hypothetical protein